MSHASWLKEIFEPDLLTKAAKKIAKQIKADRKKFTINAIAVRGMSGAVMGGVVSSMTGIPLVIVRKRDGTHSAYNVEFPEELDEIHYVIIDDLISSGATIARIHHDIKCQSDESYLKKIYLYHDGRSGTYCVGSIDRNDEYNRDKKVLVVPVWSTQREEE